MRSINKYVVSEVYEILMHLSEDEKKRLSPKTMEFLQNNRLRDYKSGIDFSKPLTVQKISKNTLSLLILFYITDLCETKNDKLEIIKILKNNSKKRGNKNG